MASLQLADVQAVYALLGSVLLILLAGIGIGVVLGRRWERAKSVAWGRGMLAQGEQVIGQLLRETQR
jgi:uncharacterized membrane protein